MPVGQETIAFPNVLVKESEKNEEYHKQMVQAIALQSVDDSYDIAFSTMNESYDFYNGLHQGEELDWMQHAEDGDVLPAEWIDFNKIKVKVDILLGQLMDSGWDINVTALNKEAETRKLKAKNEAIVNGKLQELAESLEDQFGLPLQLGTGIPQEQEEIDNFFKYTYKEKSELIVETALKWLAKKLNWDYTRFALFRDILIVGRAFAKTEIRNGLPQTRRIDPRLMVFDTNATDDFLSDSAFFGELRYQGLADVAEQYGLSAKQLEEARQITESTRDTGLSQRNNGFYSTLEGTRFKYFKTGRSEFKTLIISAVWRDFKTMRHKKSIDAFGNLHIKQLKEGENAKEVISNKYKIWRKGTLIGGTYLRDWGEMENQTRDLSNLNETHCPYKALLPNYVNGYAQSKVAQLKGLQKFKNIIMYNTQLALSRAGAKGFVYDTAQIPEGWDVHTVIKYLKNIGIAFINSKADGDPSQFNQFQSYDMSISSSVDKYIALAQYIDQEMDNVSGINEARQGIVKNASQAVGVTQAALFQSNLATASLFRLFNRFSSDIFTHQAALMKIAWADKERFAPIIGDAGVNFLKEDIDLELDDYGVFVEETSPVVDNIQNFQLLVQTALQSGQIDFVNAMKLFLEKDVKVGLKRFEKALDDQKKEQMAMQQQETEQQAQLQEQQAGLDKDKARFDAMLELMKEQQLQQGEGQIKKDIEIIKTRGNLLQENIRNIGKRQGNGA